MFATLVLAGLTAGLAPAAAPEPLPDRWLLKLVPDNLPPLSDRFYAVNWYYHASAPSQGINWELWADFRKAGKGRPAEAVLSLPGGRDGPLGLALGRPMAPGHRSVPLAVHGSLVEFERKLYTATIRTEKSDPGRHVEREMLHLGSAIELKERVWYQAGTTPPRNGKGVSVEEWRIEFREDPRIADRGTATLRGHWRVLTEPEGESFNAEVPFQAGNTYEKGRTVSLLWTGTFQPRSLASLEIAGPQGGANYMRLDNMHRLSLHPAPKPRPELPLETVGLVQPPAKKAGK